jgi:hypothetical protein
MGRGIPGAVVFDAHRSVLSDDRGRFSLPVAASRLRFIKPGFRSGSLDAVSEKQISIRLLPFSSVPTVALYAPPREGGYTRLAGQLDALGKLVSLQSLRDLKAVDVLMLLNPDLVSTGPPARLLDWIHAGGRLIVCGEWGGYAATNLSVLNALTGPTGIAFTGGTVRDPALPEFSLSVPSFELPPAGDAALTFRGATSLDIRPPARAIVTLKPPVYSIQALPASVVLAAVAPWGAGKLFAVGDTSLWRDDESGALGFAEAELRGHEQFLQALVEW